MLIDAELKFVFMHVARYCLLTELFWYLCQEILTFHTCSQYHFFS